MYDVLIFDADHTLLDYRKDEKAAFARLFLSLGKPADDALLSRACEISEQAWTAAGLYDVGSEKIQREYHVLYKTHLTGLFGRLFAEAGVCADVSKAAARFLKELEEPACLIDGARETLETLGKKYRIAVATNGLCSVQNGRMRSLQGLYSDLFVSERLSAIKPTSAFFERMLSELRVKKERCLMIGDSVSSDIDGAYEFGMDSCWLNSKGEKMRTRAKYSVQKLQTLTEFL